MKTIQISDLTRTDDGIFAYIINSYSIEIDGQTPESGVVSFSRELEVESVVFTIKTFEPNKTISVSTVLNGFIIECNHDILVCSFNDNSLSKLINKIAYTTSTIQLFQPYLVEDLDQKIEQFKKES